MENNNIRIVFFGTPEFAVESLRAIVDAGYDVAAVVTAPDKPAGRGHKMLQSDVKKFALERGLPLLQPEKLRDPEFISDLKEINADLFIVIAFRMLPELVWGMPPMGTFNLHASLLPAYRGAAPINRAIMNGEKQTGVTTFLLSHEIDTGNILHSESIEIGAEETAGELHDRLMKLGSEVVLRSLADLASGKVSPKPQPEGEFPVAPKIFREDCRIEWTRSAEEVNNHVRGLSPYPAAWTTAVEGDQEIPLKIRSVTLTDMINPGSPGELTIIKGDLYASCADGFVRIDEIQPAGKKAMQASAWLLGNKPECFR